MSVCVCAQEFCSWSTNRKALARDQAWVVDVIALSFLSLGYQELRARAGEDGCVAEGVHRVFRVPAVAVHHVVAVLRHVRKVSFAILVLW